MPFSFHEDFPTVEIARIRSHLWKTNKDLGCLKFKFISRGKLLDPVRYVDEILNFAELHEPLIMLSLVVNLNVIN